MVGFSEFIIIICHTYYFYLEASSPGGIGTRFSHGPGPRFPAPQGLAHMWYYHVGLIEGGDFAVFWEGLLDQKKKDLSKI